MLILSISPVVSSVDIIFNQKLCSHVIDFLNLRKVTQGHECSIKGRGLRLNVQRGNRKTSLSKTSSARLIQRYSSSTKTRLIPHISDV